MNTREALQVISDFIDDADSFIGGFDEEFLYGEDTYDEDGNFIGERRLIDPEYDGPSVAGALEVLGKLVEDRYHAPR